MISGYLICDGCGGYYELQPGEYPEDFEKCQCGGKLHYMDHLEHGRDIPEDDFPHEDVFPDSSSLPLANQVSSAANSISNMSKPLIIGVITVVVLLFKFGVFNFLIYYFMRYNSSNLVYSSSSYIIVLVIFMFISFFLRRFIRIKY